MITFEPIAGHLFWILGFGEGRDMPLNSGSEGFPLWNLTLP